MMRILYSAFLLGAFFVSGILPASAQEVALTARMGTLGPGLEVTTSLSDRFNARLGGHYFPYSRSDVFSDDDVDVRSDADLTLMSVSAFADWHPFRNVFRLTAGIVYNRNEVSSVVTPISSYTIDEKTFSPERIGTMEASIGHKASFNPYVGLGFGNAVSGSRLGMSFDLGVLYTDSPKVRMSGTGMIAPTANQAPDLEEDLSGITLYPLLSLGISYKL